MFFADTLCLICFICKHLQIIITKIPLSWSSRQISVSRPYQHVLMVFSLLGRHSHFHFSDVFSLLKCKKPKWCLNLLVCQMIPKKTPLKRLRGQYLLGPQRWLLCALSRQRCPVLAMSDARLPAPTFFGWLASHHIKKLGASNCPHSNEE